MEKNHYMRWLLIFWLLLIPLAAYIESEFTIFDFTFYIVINTIESVVFWAGIMLGHWAHARAMSLKKYTLVFLGVGIMLIPAASWMESMYVEESSLYFFAFVNVTQGLIFLIGLLVGYTILNVWAYNEKLKALIL